VSTLEPRKNHLALVRACLRLQARDPDLEWSLTLVGNRYAGSFHIAEAIEAIAAANPRIRWLGVVDDETLHDLYRAASFTVYPSLIEGFGMPVLESLWHGRPCVCSTGGALEELAAGGGCLTVDVRDEDALGDAICHLASEPDALLKLIREAVSRTIKGWDEYMSELLATLASMEQAGHIRSGRDAHVPAPEAAPSWHELLYPGCLTKHWQMNDSERLALTALLARRRPGCAIEIGTYEGGSLSLLSQYSGMVFSIDIDPGIPGKLAGFDNVSFLTGPSAVVLPLLLRELDTAGVPVELVLIDADHTAAGVKRDIESVLAYVPKRPLFVVIHDSFNPDCRRGMQEAGWAACPHVQWVDLDFVPGRLVEHEGPFHGQLWGGLAVALLTPARRTATLTVRTSAAGMSAAMNEFASRRQPS
jgi:hypothetical protein